MVTWKKKLKKITSNNFGMKKKQGKTSNFLWIQEATTGMKNKGINNMKWMTGKNGEEQNKTSGIERRENIDTLYINK